MCYFFFCFFCFFNDTATTEIYTLALHDALPIWLGLVVLQLEKHGPVVEAGEEEVALVDHLRSRDREAGPDFPGNGPEDLAGFRIEGVGGFRVPDDEEVTPGMADDAGRGVAWLLGGKQIGRAHV